MKKRLLIGFLVLTFLGASPYLAGWVVHYQLSTLFNNLNLPQGVSIDIERYAVRYARSWVQLKVVANDPIIPEPHTSYIRLKIFHGPIFPAENGGLSVGLARATLFAKADDIAPDNALLQDSLENFFEKNEIISGNVHFGLLGHINMTFASAPAYYKSEEGFLSFEGINGSLKVSHSLNAATFHMDVSPLLLEGKNKSILDMAAMTVDSDGKRSKKTPWIGTQSLSLPSFYLRDESGHIIRFNEFKLNTQSNMKDRLVNILLNASAKDIDFFNQKAATASLKLSLDRLGPAGLMDFSRLTQADTADVDNLEWQTARRAALVDILKNGAIASFTHAMTPETGNVGFEAKMAFPDLNKNHEDATVDELTQQLILNMKASVSLRAPLVWLENTLYELTLPYLPADAPPYTDPHTKQTIPAKEALRLDIVDQFKALNDTHILITEDGQSRFDLNYDTGHLLMNEKPLTQDDVARIMSIFEPEQ